MPESKTGAYGLEREPTLQTTQLPPCLSLLRYQPGFSLCFWASFSSGGCRLRVQCARFEWGSASVLWDLQVQQTSLMEWVRVESVFVPRKSVSSVPVSLLTVPLIVPGTPTQPRMMWCNCPLVIGCLCFLPSLIHVFLLLCVGFFLFPLHKLYHSTPPLYNSLLTYKPDLLPWSEGAGTNYIASFINVDKYKPVCQFLTNLVLS